MASGPTRADLQEQLNDRQLVIERQSRELDIIRKELQYRLDRERLADEQSKLLSRDRDRLTATVEVLSRRIATDGPSRLVGAEMAKQATPANYGSGSGSGSRL